jgi:hypothetical protein
VTQIGRELGAHHALFHALGSLLKARNRADYDFANTLEDPRDILDDADSAVEEWERVSRQTRHQIAARLAPNH